MRRLPSALRLTQPKRTSLGKSFALVHSPVVVFEAGPPVGRLEQSLEGAGEVDEAVAHQEEHG